MYSSLYKREKNLSILSLAIGAVLCTTSAQSDPTLLGDAFLDRLTAGSSSQQSGSGGAIIGNSATATLDTAAAVDISGEVQSAAAALNLVNASESTVANGVNVWGNKMSALDSADVSVAQSNEIIQEQRRSASMPNYSRPEADTYLSVVTTGSETHNNQITDINSVTDVAHITKHGINSSSGSVDTSIDASTGGPTDPRIETNTGKGVAVAGTLDAHLDGGELQVGLSVGGGITVAPDTTSDAFGGMDVTREDEDATVSIYGRIIMPELDINITGAGCGVAMGSCTSEGSSNVTEDDLTDRSTLVSFEHSEVGNSEYSETRIEEYRSPFELSDAQAEYIVVDDSSLSVTTSYVLTVSGSAQSGVRAMNVVNSAGSAVANGVNVAFSTAMDGGNLMQTNLIAHSR
ncbi:MAG: hypothetical protein GY806_11505 [Gammaproteobacteria bacterium]|nr:hypothetical protein [Gammaproteobacteria bacterium]